MTELMELLISWITLAFAFSWNGTLDFFRVFPYALIAVGTGFVFHELAHRAVARSLGHYSIYKMWWSGLLLAVLLTFATGGRFIFAAPGAVYTIPTRPLTRREEGLISLAGPAANMAVCLFVLLLSPIGSLFSLIYTVNAFLALFNLLPVPPLDGSKVFSWNPVIWFLAISAALFLWVS